MYIENFNLRKKLGMSRLMAADDGTGSGAAGTEESSEEKEEGEENSGEEETKTFTQDEVDKLIKDRLKREKKGQPTKEELKAFKEWQDSKKTNEEKNLEKITAAEQKVKEAEARANLAETKVSCLSKGVKLESIEDVVTLANAMVDDDTSIEKAIEKVLKKYPTFKGEQEVGKGFKVGAGSKSGQAKDTDEELKKIFGIKK